ncbi:unnamed protein product, partial [Amoebophrya sp. A25]
TTDFEKHGWTYFLTEYGDYEAARAFFPAWFPKWSKKFGKLAVKHTGVMKCVLKKKEFTTLAASSSGGISSRLGRSSGSNAKVVTTEKISPTTRTSRAPRTAGAGGTGSSCRGAKKGALSTCRRRAGNGAKEDPGLLQSLVAKFSSLSLAGLGSKPSSTDSSASASTGQIENGDAPAALLVSGTNMLAGVDDHSGAQTISTSGFLDGPGEAAHSSSVLSGD